MDVIHQIEEHLRRLADAGIMISIAYGPCGSQGCMYSVQCLSREGDEFDAPFAANSILHAAEIAMIECKQRGWVE